MGFKLKPQAQTENKGGIEALERVFQHVGDDSVAQEGEEGPEVPYCSRAALSNKVALEACGYLNLNHLKTNKI